MKKILDICRWFYLGLYTIITLIPHYFIEGIKYLVNPKKKKDIDLKNKSGNKKTSFLVLSLSLSVYLICIFLGSKWYVQKLRMNYLANDIKEATKVLEKEEQEDIKKENYTPKENDDYSNISFISVDFDNLIRINDETVAWLKVNNTNVNSSVVQHTDNEYYLKHDFKRNNNYAGWIYADFRDNFEYFGTNTIIYAHNMTDRTMFGSLVWTLNESWYTNTENHYIKLSTPYSNTVWRIFAIYTIKPETYYLKTYFETENDHQEFLDTLKSRSIYNFDIDLNTDDKILTLSTCTDDGTKRIVIHAKMIKAEYR